MPCLVSHWKTIQRKLSRSSSLVPENLGCVPVGKTRGSTGTEADGDRGEYPVDRKNVFPALLRTALQKASSYLQQKYSKSYIYAVCIESS